MIYKIKFPVGDHSGDGHGRNDTFIVESNVPVTKLAEVHKSSFKNLGFNIEDICCDYQNGTVSSSILDALLDKGIILQEDVEYYTDGWIDPADMLGLWLSILKYLENSLELTVVSETMPSMASYVGIPGYGLYD